ncbi:MAG: PilZ domain-containing protein [Elusimicrobia bacterium]|nr:PilZ domain-containing protein [Elusimicrobiota bacterium]
MENSCEYKERRNFARHPLDIPIEIQMDEVAASEHEYLIDISAGGLCFKSKIGLKKGKIIHIKIPLIKPIFEAEGEVMWSKKRNDHYDVGIRFVQDIDAFRIRMVEQVCHIQQYKDDVKEKEGRALNGTQAAIEWIRKYAAKFPKESEMKNK